MGATRTHNPLAYQREDHPALSMLFVIAIGDDCFADSSSDNSTCSVIICTDSTQYLIDNLNHIHHFDDIHDLDNIVVIVNN